MKFAVLDVETTGLGRADRVVEVAIVLLDERLEALQEFDTLINPLRDVGPTGIHGVTASMVTTAPRFADVAGVMANLVDGAVLVAHNLPFDVRMLAQEFARLDAVLEVGRGFDTLRLTGCSLPAACASLSIPLNSHHRALADARATADLLRVLYGGGEALEGASVVNAPPGEVARTLRREAISPSSVALPRIRPPQRYPTSDGRMLAYLHALNWVLDDAVIDETERTELHVLARDLGLDPIDTTRMHSQFLQQLVAAATRDGVVTAGEHELLRRVALALGVDTAFLPSVTADRHPATFEEGMRVCFTGDAVGRTRAELEAAAALASFRPVSGVTKACSLVVAADPATQSGKAAKARQYGIPVISVADFLDSIMVG